MDIIDASIYVCVCVYIYICIKVDLNVKTNMPQYMCLY